MKISKIVLAVLFTGSFGGCASLPMDFAINPAVPDIRKSPSSPGERTPVSLDQVRPRHNNVLTDHNVNRGGIEDVLQVAPTQ